MSVSVKYNLNKLPYLRLLEYGRFAAKLDTEAMYDVADEALASWDYAIPLEDGIRSLPGLLATAQALGAFQNTIKDFRESLSEDDDSITVDFGSWNHETWNEYQAAIKDEDDEKVVAMMKDICRGKGTKTSPLPADIGTKMWYAINMTYINAISGKV